MVTAAAAAAAAAAGSFAVWVECLCIEQAIHLWKYILIYQGVDHCTKVCDLHLDISLIKNRKHKKSYLPFTDQLQPIYLPIIPSRLCLLVLNTSLAMCEESM